MLVFLIILGVIVLGVLALVLFKKKKPVDPVTPGAFSIQVKKTPYGIQLETSGGNASAKAARFSVARAFTADAGAQFSSDDERVVDLPAPTIDDVSEGTVATLNTHSGIVTPVGSAPATFVVTANDGVSTATATVTTDTINLAGLDGSNSTNWIVSSIPDAKYSSFLGNVFTFVAKAAESALHPEKFNGQLNAGYYVAAQGPTSGLKFSWIAIDGQLYLYSIPADGADTTGAYDQTALDYAIAHGGVQTVGMQFAVDGSNQLQIVVPEGIIVLTPQ